MITKLHIVFDILNTARGGKQSDDENISLRQVGFNVDNTRALLIKRDLDKGSNINPDIVQTLGCVPVKLVDSSECDCLEVGCKILRTVDKIPKAIDLANKNLITRVGPIQVGSTPFSFISYERAGWESSSRYQRRPKAFLHNGYIYILSEDDDTNLMKYITISGVFEFPEEVANFTDCPGGKPCYTDATTYPISSWMIEPLKDMIYKNTIRIAVQSPTDSLGNANHDVEPNVTQ